MKKKTRQNNDVRFHQFYVASYQNRHPCVLCIVYGINDDLQASEQQQVSWKERKLNQDDAWIY